MKSIGLAISIVEKIGCAPAQAATTSAEAVRTRRHAKKAVMQ